MDAQKPIKPDKTQQRKNISMPENTLEWSVGYYEREPRISAEIEEIKP